MRPKKKSSFASVCGAGWWPGCDRRHMHFIPSTLLIAGCANIFRPGSTAGRIYTPIVCVSLPTIWFDAPSFSASEAIYSEVVAILRRAAGECEKKRKKREKGKISLTPRRGLVILVSIALGYPASLDDRIILPHIHAFLLVTEPSNRALFHPRLSLSLSLFGNRLSAVSYKVTSTCSPILPISFILNSLSTLYDIFQCTRCTNILSDTVKCSIVINSVSSFYCLISFPVQEFLVQFFGSCGTSYTG